MYQGNQNQCSGHNGSEYFQTEIMMEMCSNDLSRAIGKEVPMQMGLTVKCITLFKFAFLNKYIFMDGTITRTF